MLNLQSVVLLNQDDEVGRVSGSQEALVAEKDKLTAALQQHDR